jgi:TonB-linked SusC/RagA family outer membrane protein
MAHLITGKELRPVAERPARNGRAYLHVFAYQHHPGSEMNTPIRARRAVVGALVLLTGLGAAAEAQNAVLTGTVTSNVGQPLSNANVFITEMGISVGTNAQGVYTITIPAARVSGQAVNLRARAFGFQPAVRLVRITEGTFTFNFALAQDVLRLNEVVVTGVVEGVERAKVPFAVARLSTEDMPVPALDPLRALAGKVSGVRIAQTSGRPGSTPEIMLRGPTSINSTGRPTGPLIIVDNVIMNVGSLEELGGLDIESVEVVKGAAGASLYGSRAANGVITIRTKRGSGQDGIRFSARSEYGFNDLNSLDYGLPVNHHLQLDETGRRFCVQGSANIAHCSRTLDWMTEIMRINNVNADTVRTPQLVQWNAPGTAGGELVNVFQSNQWPGRYYDALAQVLRMNPVTLNSIDATGKMGNVRFYVSGSYQDEQGAIKGLNGSQHRRGRVNLDYDARQDLLISVSTVYDNATIDLRSGGGLAGGTIFGQLLRGAPAGTDYLARDTLGRPLVRGGGANLRGTGNGAGTFLYDTESANQERNSNRFIGALTGRYFPKEWFTFEASFGYDHRNFRDDWWRIKGYRTQGISTPNNNGRIALERQNEEAFNTSLTATFRRQFRPDLNAKFSVRGLYEENRLWYNADSAEAFVVREVYTTTNATQNKITVSNSEIIRNTGLFAGGDIDFKDRYIVGGTFRYDGSSLFGEGNRWAPFGRLSAVWRVSQEEFWNVPWVNDFRLRASRGTAGNRPRFNAQYETYTITPAGIIQTQAGNSQLKPETTTETEVGTDFTLLNRFGVELTYAHGVTEDQILPVQVPAALGYARQWQNAGTLLNKTWELALNLPILTRRDLSWSMRGTWDRTRTFITELFAPEFVMDANTLQGTGSLFRVSASRAKSNGFQINRFGNIWGRKFYRSCRDLPASVQSQCGEGRAFQRNDQGWLVWVGEGNSWRDGITRNLWGTILPASESPWNYPLQFGHPIIDRPLRGEVGEGVGIQQVLGNVFPDFRFSVSNNVQYKRFNLYALVDATIGQDINNQGEGWGLLDFNSAYFDQGGQSVETAKPVGYSWRAGGTESTGTGGFYDLLGPNNYVVEDASFAKLREVSLTYQIGQVRGWGDWTVGVIGRNLFTITNYTGLDPEVGCGGRNNNDFAGSCGSGGSTTQGTGSGLINQVDAFGFPTLRTFTFTVTNRF